MATSSEAYELVPDPSLIRFERAKGSHLSLIHRWLNTPHVSRWWPGEKPSYREVEDKYIPRIEGREPTEPYLILHGEKPIGYIQTYRISDHPEYGGHVQLARSAGVDLFIGEGEYLHRGLGANSLRRFLREVVFAGGATESCVIGPAPKNTAAIRAYEKAGFGYFKTIHVSGEPEYLMKISRGEVLAE